MKRKINLVGMSTLTVSIPTSWVNKNNLTKGDEVEVAELENDIIISCKPKDEWKEIFVDVTDVSSMTTFHCIIIRFYMMGYKKIMIKYDPEMRTSAHYDSEKINTFEVIKNLVGNLSGMEITESKLGYCVLEEVMNIGNVSVENLFRRGMLLLIDYARSMEKSGPEYPDKYLSHYKKLYENDKFFKHAIKSLNLSEINRAERDRLLMMISNMQLIGFTYSLYNLLDTHSDISKKCLKEVNDLLHAYYEQCFGPKLDKIDALATEINNVQKRYMLLKGKEIYLMQILLLLKMSIAYLPIHEIMNK